MDKAQAEKMIRNALSQLALPLNQHQQLQHAMNVLVAPAKEELKKDKPTPAHNEAG